MNWFSTIRSASGENWWRAAKEVFVIGLISLIPLIFKAAYYYFKFLSSDIAISFTAALWRYVVSHELLFFSVSNLAAVIWISSQDFRARFDQRIYFILLSTLGLCICSFFIGVSPEMVGIPEGVVRTVAVLTFFASLLMNVIMLVFERYSAVDLHSSLAHEEDDTTRRLRQRRSS